MAITKEEIIYRRLEMYRDTLLLNCYPDSFAVDHFFFQKTSQDGFYDSCYIDTEQKVRNIYFPKNRVQDTQKRELMSIEISGNFNLKNDFLFFVQNVLLNVDNEIDYVKDGIFTAGKSKPIGCHFWVQSNLPDNNISGNVIFSIVNCSNNDKLDFSKCVGFFD